MQIDSVIGRIGGKCLLTIHFVETSFMLAFLRDANTSASVIQVINLLDKVLGSSFDDLTQADIFLMMDHINSYKRKKLNNRSPYETFSFYYGEEVLHKLGCKPVAAENIILKPKLLKK